MEHRNKYIIKARHMRGVKVLGYYLESTRDGSRRLVNKESAQELALGGFITNCKAQVYNNDVVMKGVGCKISELPIIDADTGKLRGVETKKKTVEALYEITARVINGKHVLGYVIQDRGRVPIIKTKKEVVELTRRGLVSNARIQMSNGVPILRGVNCELAKINTIRASDLN